METVRTSAMIFTILIGAILLNNFFVLSAVPDAVGDWITVSLSQHGNPVHHPFNLFGNGVRFRLFSDDPTNNPNLSGDTTIGHGSGLV